MSEGIFGKNADLAQRLKDRIAFHANEHRHTYEIGKGVMDALVLDLLADFRDAGCADRCGAYWDADSFYIGADGKFYDQKYHEGGEDHDVP